MHQPARVGAAQFNVEQPADGVGPVGATLEEVALEPDGFAGQIRSAVEVQINLFGGALALNEWNRGLVQAAAGRVT